MKTIRVLSCALMLLASCATPAYGSGPPNEFGKVWRVDGDVVAVSPGGAVRRLLEGSVVYVGEQVRSVSHSEVVIRTRDAGLVALRPNTEFEVVAYQVRDTWSDKAIFKLLRGSLRVVSGWIGRLHRDHYEVRTPAASLGIRGTDFEPVVLDVDAAGVVKAQPGTYDKVNRGLTTLESSVGKIDVPAGRVGFAADLGSQGESKKRDRALITLLMPRLLDTVPGFYVGGVFEKDIDEFSEEDEEHKHSGAPSQGSALTCDPQSIGEIWIRRLDGAVERRDASAILKLFADNARIEATVIGGDGAPVKQSLDRSQFSASVTTAMAGVSEFEQHRTAPEIEADTAAETSCAQVRMSSHVIEQGKMGGKPYRVESDEHYVLERRSGVWVAVEATTRQR